ncbi:MAG: phage portal protein [Dehalococcoides mccartyi]|uniref:phage portal protein n=1 Tax=Dehalococcoides mccartyi TaxID=61435 RepID=UPI0030FA5A7E
MLDKIRNKIALSMLDKKSFDLTSPEFVGFFQGLYSMFSLPGRPVYTDIPASKAIREGYKMAIPIYRGIRSLIQAVSGIPWIVLDKKGEQIPDHPFVHAWNYPNPEFSGQDNMEYIVGHLMLVGNAYIRPIYVNQQPREFWMEMPDQIQPIPSRDRNKWLEGWQYTDGSGVKHTVAKETFIQFKQIDPGNFYTGMGAIMPAGRVIDIYNEGLDTQKVSMQNRGMPSGHLFPEEPLTPEQFDDFKRKFQESYLDKSSRRMPWLYPRKMNWIEANMTPIELDYNNSLWTNIRQLAAAIGLDPWWLGDREHSSFNNVQEARRSLYEDNAIPMLDDIKSTLNLKVAPLYGGDIKIAYDVSNVTALREDFSKKSEQANRLWSMGVPLQQINKILELGIDEFPGWERSYLPFSVAPVMESGLPEIVNEPETTGAKSLNMTEEQKVAEWKRIDSRRVGWWGVLEKRFEPLYTKLGSAVAKNPDSLDDVLKSLSPEWEKTLTAITLTLIEDFGKQTADRLKTNNRLLEFKFDPFSAAIKAWATAHAAESVKTIMETQQSAMHDLITYGISNNLSNTQIAKSIRQFYTDNARSLAMRVARTETAIAAGYGQSAAGKQSGANKRRWLSSRDDRVRDAHVALDGQTVGIDEQYSNGMAHVGDPAGGPENIINCRCVEQFFKE